MIQKNKNMIISIGGSPEPAIFSIKSERPKNIIFFASDISSKNITDTIIPNLKKEKKYKFDYRIIITPDSQNLGISLLTLFKEIPKELKALGINSSHWLDIVDYTCGTKTMSSALVWVSSKYAPKFSYIGSKSSSDRDKNGAGIVINGREVSIITENPWNKIAYFELQNAFLLFNKNKYIDAAETLKLSIKRISNSNIRKMIEGLVLLSQALHLWDTFVYPKALEKMNNSISILKKITQDTSFIINEYQEFIKQTIIARDYLSYIPPNKPSINAIWDIIANAIRRGRAEKKYYDAVIRCEMALDKIAEFELVSKFAINPKTINLEDMPERFKQQFLYNFPYRKNIEKKGFSLGTVAAFALLQDLNSNTGIKFFQNQKLLEYYQNKKDFFYSATQENIDKKNFDFLLKSILNITNINTIVNLPKFPSINYKL